MRTRRETRQKQPVEVKWDDTIRTGTRERESEISDERRAWETKTNETKSTRKKTTPMGM
jgi:hypothetical protein